MKKLLFAFLFAAVAIVSASAQDAFVGRWTRTKVEGTGAVSAVTDLQIAISKTGNELKFERKSSGMNGNKPFTNTITQSFKIKGGDSAKLIPGRFGGVMIERFTVHNPSRIEIGTTFNADNEQMNRTSREFWTLSNDGKTLTVEYRNDFASTTMVFTKQ